MKKRNWLFIFLLISIVLNLSLSYTNIATFQSNSKNPVGTYMFSMDIDGDEEYEQYYLLFYPDVTKEYEIRVYVGSSTPDNGMLCKEIEKGVYELEYDNYVIHTTSSEGLERYFFLTTDDVYFTKDNNLIVCEKQANHVYRF